MQFCFKIIFLSSKASTPVAATSNPQQTTPPKPQEQPSPQPTHVVTPYTPQTPTPTPVEQQQQEKSTPPPTSRFQEYKNKLFGSKTPVRGKIFAFLELLKVLLFLSIIENILKDSMYQQIHLIIVRDNLT